MIIGISGFARSGKDTFYKIFKNIYSKYETITRVAFADQIKEDLKPLLFSNFKIDPFSCSDKEKEIIRPLMVSYGTHVARSLDKDFWIKKVKPKIIHNQNNNFISVITDIRYENEQIFLQKNFKNVHLVHINRFGFGPANEEEEENIPLLQSNSDYEIHWRSFVNGDDEGVPFIESFINDRIKTRQ